MHGTNHEATLVQRCCLTCLKKDHKSVEGRRLRAIAMIVCKIDLIEIRELFVTPFTFRVNETSENLPTILTMNRVEGCGTYVRPCIVLVTP